MTQRHAPADSPAKGDIARRHDGGVKGMQPDDQYSPEEAATRRDEVIRRMAHTPPQPRHSSAKSGSKSKDN